MARLYVDHDQAHFTKVDLTLVNMELTDGRKFENLEPRRLFPLSVKDKYITLLDRKGNEAAIIRDLGTLPAKERRIIKTCLEEYYLIPKITKINKVLDKYGLLTIDTETDRGHAVIEIRGAFQSIKEIYSGRVLIRDTNDNRYEIPDLSALDKHSISLIGSYL